VNSHLEKIINNKKSKTFKTVSLAMAISFFIFNFIFYFFGDSVHLINRSIRYAFYFMTLCTKIFCILLKYAVVVDLF
jgi:uncharacterized protein with PQ loop repeat